MGSFERIADRLPAIYRPQRDEPNELSAFLAAVGSGLDAAGEEVSALLFTHWFRYADSALLNPWFRRTLELAGKPLPKANDASVLQFPYINDLGRLAALFCIRPWEQGSEYRESVESFRLRVSRIVRAFTNGLGTLEALRTMVEASLPLQVVSGEPLIDLPFGIEEFPAITQRREQAKVKGIPEEIMGPLMRWRVESRGLYPAAPTVYIQGIAAQEKTFDATTRPCIELLSCTRSLLPKALAYKGTVPAGSTLRVRPAALSLIGTAAGIAQSRSAPAADAPAAPSPCKTWEPLAGAPSGIVAALCQTADKRLWAAVNADTGSASKKSALWSWDGTAWECVARRMPFCYALYETGGSLLVATQTGIARVDMYAEDPRKRYQGIVYTKSAPVYCMAEINNVLWAGTEQGVWRVLPAAGTPESYFPFAKIYSIAQEAYGIVYYGADCGLLRYDPASSACHVYQGKEHSDAVADWVPFAWNGASLPIPAAGCFLPPVKAVLRSKDGWLWAGTAAGIARYGAVKKENDVYTTRLSAFPTLDTGAVNALAEDERGRVWFCASKGLFIHDGRDFYRKKSGTLERIIPSSDGQAHELAGRVISRYNRGAAAWQSFNETADRWDDPAVPPDGAGETGACSVAFADTLSADLGTWDGTNFTPSAAVSNAEFVVRCKITRRRIISGGIPALPRVPVGTSTWRYCSLEAAGEAEAGGRLRWSCEGRQLFGNADLPDPPPGRFDDENDPAAVFGNAVYAFLPCSRVWMEWYEQAPCTVLVRLDPENESGTLDTVIIDRVWQAITMVRPAGIRAVLAINETIVRG